MPRRLGPFEHDAVRRLMRYRGRALELTLHEYRLLEVLLAYPGRVYSRGELLERAWEAPDHRLERTVDSHVKSLRAKLRAADPASDPIRTHRGSGYSLDLAP
jgi:two-component system catabolic regulation response regulator CreB